ncbi:helix-turn-helix domain-containing protein [Streptomyces sp. NBC_00631]|uniref:helix-turn-helix domain-containing protein n=1 Tax=Streptomyces sp. NBC_00631 TaxID=2975793 RepID=UPI0030E58064
MAAELVLNDGSQARFALALRRLRDEAGFNAKTIDVIAAENHMSRSTLYAAMRGARIPTVPVLAALVRAWGGDQVEWLIGRTETEAEIEGLRLQAHLPADQEQSGPEEKQRTEHRSTTRRGIEMVQNILQDHGDLKLSEISEPLPEDRMVKPWWRRA